MGVEKALISKELKQLFNNIKFWIESESYDPDEITIRFIHRLMQIQCFPDGNARHAKLMADIVMEHVFNGDGFTWGSSLQNPSLAREKFLEALKKADKGKMEDLLKIARL
jgi:fido (protein-threonine AMPylation protein)